MHPLHKDYNVFLWLRDTLQAHSFYKYNRFFETLEIGEELLGLELRKKFADLSVSSCFIKDEFLESSRISDHFCNFRKDEAF